MTGKDALIVSVSGIRGIVGSSLFPETAANFSAALGTYVGGGLILVSRDGRPSGNMLRDAVHAGLLSTGCEVRELGITPTPTVGFAVRRTNARGAIQITASHNPAEWNGLKLFGADGCVLTARHAEKVRGIFESRQFRRASSDQPAVVSECRNAADWHRDRILELIDVDRIRAAQLRVFLDANGGAGGELGRSLLESLRCRVICHGCHADGVFEHLPEPTSENLSRVALLVAQNGANIGFALDPDADRLALIDETGHYVGEELTLALAVRFRLGREPGPVVVNMSTSRVVEDIAKQFACPFYRSAVGEANVVEKMKEVGAIIGGEGNGGVIDPRVGGVRDPFIGMGLILNLLAETGKTLSAIVAELPQYHIVKEKFSVDRKRLPAILAKVESQWPDAQINRDDGLRLDWRDRWIHVRPSNTEPIVRVIAEAPTAPTTRALCDEVERLLTSND